MNGSTSFWDLLLWSFWIFIWISAIIIWFRCVFDLFTDHTLSGWGKAGWAALLIFLPLAFMVVIHTEPVEDAFGSVADLAYEIFCLAIAFIGLGVRIVTSSSAAVGWTAMVASKSALVAPIFTAMPASWIISPASGPQIWTPRTRSVSPSTTSFISMRVSRPEMVCFIGRNVAL